MPATYTPFDQSNLLTARQEPLEVNLRRHLTWLGLAERWTGLELGVIATMAPAADVRGQGGAFPTSIESAIALAKRADATFDAVGVFLRPNILGPWQIECHKRDTWEQAKRGRSTIDMDIHRRRCFFVDFDPERGDEGASTRQEMELTFNRARRAVGYLAQFIPVAALALAMSGNGAHVHVRLDDLDESDEVADLVHEILHGLARRFGDGQIKVDLTVGNPSRYCPAFGTIKRKGDNSADRPYRRTFFVCYPVPARLSLDDLRHLHAAVRVQGGPPRVRASHDASREVDPQNIWARCNAVSCRAVGARLGLDWEHPKCPGCGAGGSKTDVAWLDADHSARHANFNILCCRHDTCGQSAWTPVELVSKLAYAYRSGDPAGNAELCRKILEWFAREFGIIDRQPIPLTADEQTLKNMLEGV